MDYRKICAVFRVPHAQWGIAARFVRSDGVGPTGGVSLDKSQRGRDMDRLSVSSDAGWLGLGDALRALKARGGMGMLGIRLTPALGVTVLDIDVPEGHEVSDDLWGLVRGIGGHVHRSSSGRGLHVVLRGTLRDHGLARDGVRVRHGVYGLELYSARRFMIVSDDVVQDTEVADDWLAQIDAFCGGRVRRVSSDMPVASGEWPPCPEPAGESRLSVVRTRLEVVAPDLLPLFDGESRMHYPSGSEADAALVSGLCRCLGTAREVAAVWLGCRGAREKVRRRADYLWRTILLVRGSLDDVLLDGRPDEESPEPPEPMARGAALPFGVRRGTDESRGFYSVPENNPFVDDSPKYSSADDPEPEVFEVLDFGVAVEPPGVLGSDAAWWSRAKPGGLDYAVLALLCVTSASQAGSYCGPLGSGFGSTIHGVVVGDPGAGKSVIDDICSTAATMRAGASVSVGTLGGRVAVSKMRAEMPAGVIRISEAGREVDRLARGRSSADTLSSLQQIVQMWDRSHISAPEVSLTIPAVEIPAGFFQSSMMDLQPRYVPSLLSRDISGSGLLSRLTIVHSGLSRECVASRDGVRERLKVAVDSRPVSDVIVVGFDSGAKVLAAWYEDFCAKRVEKERARNNYSTADWLVRAYARCERVAVAASIYCGRESISEEVLRWSIVWCERGILRIYDDVSRADAPKEYQAMIAIAQCAHEVCEGEIPGHLIGEVITRAAQVSGLSLSENGWTRVLAGMGSSFGLVNKVLTPSGYSYRVMSMDRVFRRVARERELRGR